MGRRDGLVALPLPAGPGEKVPPFIEIPEQRVGAVSQDEGERQANAPLRSPPDRLLKLGGGRIRRAVEHGFDGFPERRLARFVRPLPDAEASRDLQFDIWEPAEALGLDLG